MSSQMIVELQMVSVYQFTDVCNNLLGYRVAQQMQCYGGQITSVSHFLLCCMQSTLKWS